MNIFIKLCSPAPARSSLSCLVSKVINERAKKPFSRFGVFLSKSNTEREKVLPHIIEGERERERC